jgi:hypothetical protein
MYGVCLARYRFKSALLRISTASSLLWLDLTFGQDLKAHDISPQRRSQALRARAA